MVPAMTGPSMDPSKAFDENSQRFERKHFLCSLCYEAKTMSEFPKSDVSMEVSLKGTFQVDAIEQCGRRDKVRISGMIEESGEDVYQMKVVVAKKQVLLSRRKISAFVTD